MVLGQNLLLRKALPQEEQGYTGDSVLLKGLGGFVQVPLCRVFLKVKGQSKCIIVGIADELQISNVDLLMGNEIGDGVSLWPLMAEETITEELVDEQSIDQ